MTENNNVQVGEFPLPMNTYSVRCIGCIFKTSSKGNAMYEQKWEIVTPTANWKGQTWKTAGLQFTNWTTLTDKAEDANKKLLAKLQINPSLDPSNPTPDVFLGIGARAVLVGTERKWKNKIEQADGSFIEEEMLDTDGKSLVTYDINLHGKLGFVGRDKTADLNVAF